MLNRSVAEDGKVAELGDEHGALALVFHHRLIAFLDKNGNVRADPHWLKGNVMPRVAGCSPEDCRNLAAALVDHDLAAAYEVDGYPYLHFPHFREHQVGLRAERESPEVPVPQGFDGSAGTMPANVRRRGGDQPDNVRPQVEVEVERTTPTPRARARGNGSNYPELGAWLGDYATVLEDCALAADRQTQRALFQHFGPPGMRPNAWAREDGGQVPDEDRPRLLALALSGYAAEGKTKIVTNEFAAMLRRAIRDATSGAERESDVDRVLSDDFGKRA
jgi:hypothetical protein